MGAVHHGRLVGLAFGQVVGFGGLVGIGRRRCQSRGGGLTYWGALWRHLRARRCGGLAYVFYPIFERKCQGKQHTLCQCLYQRLL
jgi:hypothetical protein